MINTVYNTAAKINQCDISQIIVEGNILLYSTSYRLLIYQFHSQEAISPICLKGNKSCIKSTGSRADLAQYLGGETYANKWAKWVIRCKYNI